jgi:hypothetical protein
MAQVFFLGIVFYLVYRLIFDLVVPVYKTTKQVKRQFGDMHEQMRQHANAYQQQRPAEPAPERPAAKAGEYIDFEEVKS